MNLTESKKRFVQKFNELFPFNWELLREAGAEPIPNHLKKWWFCLGGTPLYLFVVQLITGIALTIYYVPSAEHAYDSVAKITHEIRFGWYIRSLHKWSANLMIVAVFLHMLRVFFTAAYRYPRQLNWMVGCGLLGVTLTFGFTGYSLIFEQLSFWGATVAANLAEATPVIGDYVAYFMRGGPEVGGPTLTRFYILHIGILPTAMFMLLAIHVYLIRTHGVTELTFEGQELPAKKRYFPFWPDHATMELLVGVLVMYLLTILALVFPAEMGEQADPTRTPAVIKPEWYFYFSFRLLKLTSVQVSLWLTMAIGGIVFLWPFIEESLVKRFNMSEKVPIFLGIFGFLGFLVLTVWEAFAH